MLAIAHAHYGPPDTLQLVERERPRLRRPTDVLLRVHATSLHVADSFVVRGSPALVRLGFGLLRPRQPIVGQDCAGVVVEVGPAVQRLRPGNLVFGIADGSCAEFARADERHLALLPLDLDPIEAAALPTGGLAALHGLRDAGRLRAGQRLLVHGAAGGVGSCAVQLGKAFHAEVTAVCSTRNVEWMRRLGADHVIDHTQHDWTQGDERYDVILDNVENLPLGARRRRLAKNGTLVCNSGTGASGLRFLGRLLAPVLLAPFVGQRLRRYLSTPNADDLELLADLVTARQLRPFVERTYPLAATREALLHVESGRVRGRVVVVVAGDPMAPREEATQDRPVRLGH